MTSDVGGEHGPTRGAGRGRRRAGGMKAGRLPSTAPLGVLAAEGEGRRDEGGAAAERTRAMRLILSGAVLVVAGVAVLFAQVAGILSRGLVLAVLAFAATLVGLLLGLAGLPGMAGAPRERNEDGRRKEKDDRR